MANVDTSKAVGIGRNGEGREIGSACPKSPELTLVISLNKSV